MFAGAVAVGRLQCPWGVLDEEGEIPAQRAGVHPDCARNMRTGVRRGGRKGRETAKGRRRTVLEGAGTRGERNAVSDRAYSVRRKVKPKSK